MPSESDPNDYELLGNGARLRRSAFVSSSGASGENLDEDFPQYIHDNTDDEITHFTFLNAYLESKGAEPVNLESRFARCRAARPPDPVDNHG